MTDLLTKRAKEVTTTNTTRSCESSATGWRALSTSSVLISLRRCGAQVITEHAMSREDAPLFLVMSYPNVHTPNE